MTAPGTFQRHLRLHGNSGMLMLFDLTGILCGVAALSLHRPSMVLLGCGILGFSVGGAQYDVSRCAFARTMPGYWAEPRRVILQLGAWAGALALVVAGSLPETRHAPWEVVRLVAAAAAVAVAVAAARMDKHAGWATVAVIWLAQAMMGAEAWLRGLPDWGVIGGAVAAIGASALWLAPARLGDRFAVADLPSSIDLASAKTTVANRAARAAAVRAVRSEPIGTQLLRWSASWHSSRLVSDVLVALADGIGAFSVARIALVSLAIVVLPVLLQGTCQTSYTALLVLIGMVAPAQLLARGRRSAIVLPLGRSERFRRQVTAVLVWTLVTLAFLAAFDALAVLAEAEAIRLSAPWIRHLHALPSYPAVIVGGTLAAAVVPTTRVPIVGSVLLLVFVCIGVAANMAVADAGLAIRLGTCLLGVGAAVGFVRAHTAVDDLA